MAGIWAITAAVLKDNETKNSLTRKYRVFLNSIINIILAHETLQNYPLYVGNFKPNILAGSCNLIKA